MAQLPQIIKWGSVPYDQQDKRGQFEHCQWNYFLKDRENGVLAGYWEASEGHEDLGAAPFHQMLHVVEGKLYIQGEGEDEARMAGPGDTVMAVVGRKMRLTVRQPVRAFFVCFPVDDIDRFDQNVKKEP
ncbi:MAG: hypothetical protein GKR89_14575 [Candidatus Latescibacteria bacterium]|nr:hypothetical protein [Candidatus Latescibacterota bacterium]